MFGIPSRTSEIPLPRAFLLQRPSMLSCPFVPWQVFIIKGNPQQIDHAKGLICDKIGLPQVGLSLSFSETKRYLEWGTSVDVKTCGN